MTDTVRKSVLDFVRRFPAVHVREMERSLGLSERLAAYHLARLVDEGLVRRVNERGYSRYWAAETQLDAGDIRRARILRRPHAYQMVLLLLDAGEVSAGELGERVGLSKATASYHLGLLLKARLVAAREEGRHRFYSLFEPADVRTLLRRIPPVPGSLDQFATMWDDLVG